MRRKSVQDLFNGYYHDEIIAAQDQVKKDGSGGSGVGGAIEEYQPNGSNQSTIQQDNTGKNSEALRKEETRANSAVEQLNKDSLQKKLSGVGK